MNKNHKSYTDSFRDQSVDLLLSSGRPLKQIAVELGVSAGTLRSWRDKRIGSCSEGVAEAQGAETLEMKVKRLERENNYLRRQRDILKKLRVYWPKIRRQVYDDRFNAENLQHERTL